MRIREKRSSGNPLWWLFELLIVFLGVYGAFLLDNYQGTLRNEKKARAIYDFFLAECDMEKKQIDQEQLVFDSVVNEFMTGYKNGEMPDIFGVPIFFTSSVNTRVWEAILASGGTDVLDFETTQMIDQYETSKLNTLAILNKGEIYAREFLIPAMERPKSEFYNLWTKALKPQYKWYLKFLRSFQQQYTDLASSNEKLTEFLTKKMDKK